MNDDRPFRSLRLRLLAPMVVVAMLAAVLVSVASYCLGDRESNKVLESRFAEIETTLSTSHFPLSPTVLTLLSNLTQTELISFDQTGQSRFATVDFSDPQSKASLNRLSHSRSVTLGDQTFRIFSFATANSDLRSDQIGYVAVLFDENQIESSRWRAALLPLVTGLSTIVALSSITLLLTSRLVSRVEKLQRRVETVAGGDFASGNFDVTVADEGGDEIGRLGRAVDSMARQLDRLWKRVHRQQSEKLLHQIASGMAHQLRNSLTGARMAVELHAADCPNQDDEGVDVAIRQIELAEDYVRRLTMVASGQQDQDRPTDVLTCFDDIRTSLSPIAKHLKVNIQWDNALPGSSPLIQDGPTWVAAVTNLIHNAMQAGDQISVSLSLISDNAVQVRVVDNGPGVNDAIASEIFEPFVTSKPEGMGLGLSVVKRAAEQLGGDARWYRQNESTVFEFESATDSSQETP